MEGFSFGNGVFGLGGLGCKEKVVWADRVVVGVGVGDWFGWTNWESAI